MPYVVGGKPSNEMLVLETVCMISGNVFCEHSYAAFDWTSDGFCGFRSGGRQSTMVFGENNGFLLGNRGCRRIFVSTDVTSFQQNT